MTNKSEKPGGNDSGGGSGSKKRQRGKKGKNTPSDSQSTASSSKTTSPKSQHQQKPEKPSSSSTQKIQILKRDPSKNVTAIPVVASVMPLMDVNLSVNPPQPPTTPKYHQNHQNPQNQNPPKSQNQRVYPHQTPEKSEKSGGMNTIERRSEANKQQTQAYYFSRNAGTAVSGDKFKQPSQYKMNNFPLERNVNIFIEGKYSLMITLTNNRCNGLFIRVQSQHDDFRPTGALLSQESDDETIRNACIETIQNFATVAQKTASERYPYSICSEPYLKSCLIKRLDDRLDAFPDAIYYCEKCDYHISTMGHAKSHLESSSHFDDIKRQEQREHLVKHIPKPSKNHLRSIRKLLDDVLEDYKKVQEIGNEKASHILYYLQTTVFPAAIGNRNVQLRPFGSATYDTVMPDSDYNVAYTMDLPENEPIFSMLEKVRARIVDDGHPADHSMEMGTPSTILFTFEGVRVRLCWMSCFNYRSQLYFTDLMKTYVSLREEVVHFLQLIRLWACKAGVDSKNKPRIGLPRYGFDIMAIHFLQKQGFLPILHEMYEESEKTTEFDEQSLNSAAGDDASERSRIPPEEAGPRRMRLMSKYEKDVEKIQKKFDLTKQWDQSDLFIKFFKYYVEKNRDIVVQITQTAPISRDANRWNKKILHVVDPFRGDNVLSIPKVSTWQPYYFNCLLTTYLSFAIPRTKDGPLVEISLIHSKSATKKKVKEPQTPKRNGEPPISTTPMHNIPEEDYNRAADLLAQEAEDEKYINDLKSKLMFDGIKHKDLKPANFEIDDHWQSVYSRKALTRFRRVWPTRLNERIAISLEDHDLLNNKFGKRWMKRWRKGELGRSESLEMEEKVAEVLKEEDKDVAEITEKMEEMLGIVESQESQIATEEETPVTVIEKDLVSQQSEIKDESMVMSEIEQNEAEKNKDTSIPEDPETSEAIVMCIRSVVMEEPEDVPKAPEASGNVKDSEALEDVASSVSDAPEAPKSVVPTTTSEVTIATPSKSSQTIQKSTATFVKTKAIPVAEKQICCEEFFIKENVDFKEIAVKAKRLHQHEFQFEFSSELFCGGYEMEMKCTHCDGSHCVEKCPMMEIPPIIKYEARTPEELKDIDAIIDRYYQENILNDERLKLMEERKTELERYMQEKYRKDVNLTIFGSVMTGLSVNCSDIDICLRFGSGDTPPKELTPKDVIIKTERVLRICGGGLVRKVQAITTAKVPIVKFQLLLINDEYIDADISYYNILAIYNTALLKEYTLWTPDHRFAKLALYIKRWAKHCDIGDASRGSLSSYAHIIMLISYLQNCDPPVLPRLQEDFRSDNDEKRLVENWDTSYAQVERQLLETWPKNKESCAQLLIGYFDYYSRFDFRNFVVQCRREMILSKMEKDWPRPLCVEDPFDLHHNLSSGITKKMFVFIMKVFINSRAVFMSEKPTVARDLNFVRNYQDQLLRKCHQGSAPSDRQCHNCHRIGHFFESCPMKPLKDARRRYGSNSTNSSYRSNEGYRNYRAGTSDDSTAAGGDRLISHKRVGPQKTFYSRK